MDGLRWVPCQPEKIATLPFTTPDGPPHRRTPPLSPSIAIFRRHSLKRLVSKPIGWLPNFVLFFLLITAIRKQKWQKIKKLSAPRNPILHLYSSLHFSAAAMKGPGLFSEIGKNAKGLSQSLPRSFPSFLKLIQTLLSVHSHVRCSLLFILAMVPLLPMQIC